MKAKITPHGQIPANKCRLRDVAISISQDLEALQEIVQSCQSTIDTSKLYEAISSLEAYVSKQNISTRFSLTRTAAISRLGLKDARSC